MNISAIAVLSKSARPNHLVYSYLNCLPRLHREGNGSPLSVLAWIIAGTGEPGGLPSVGSHRVGHD